MSEESEPYAFKFHWLDENGNQSGFFRQKGQFHEGVLTLEDKELPAAAILQSQTVENRIMLTVPTGDDEYANILFMPTSKSVTEALKQRLDIARSRVWADHHREQLATAGRAHDYRDAVCPECDATIIVSDMLKSPQLFCHFCESLSTIDQNPPQGESKLRLCEECGMYSQPLKFTTFYFYFLLVVYGWRSNTAWKCRACMRSDAWKMLAANFIFILGVPWAIYQLIRAYSGGSMIEGAYAGLNGANIAARKQNWDKATQAYRQVLENVGVSAGVKYNLGLALREADRDDQAARSFELALQDCSNYAPAYAHLVELYPKLNESSKLEALKAQWEDAEAQQEETGEDPATIL